MDRRLQRREHVLALVELGTTLSGEFHCVRPLPWAWRAVLLIGSAYYITTSTKVPNREL
jgi:hypothetical protein